MCIIINPSVLCNMLLLICTCFTNFILSAVFAKQNSRWVANLSTFAGLLHRRHFETDCKPILSWAVRSLGEGGEAAMAAGKVRVQCALQPTPCDGAAAVAAVDGAAANLFFFLNAERGMYLASIDEGGGFTF